jgi:aspartate aminotransferase
MTSIIADRLNAIKPSPTLAVGARAIELNAQGKNIISLSLGEPDFPAPAHMKRAAIEAIEHGSAHYTATEGTLSLRKAICEKFQRDNNLRYMPNQILASCGAKHSIYNACMSLLNPEDEVIIPAPYWVSYPDMVILAEAKPVIINAGHEQNFKITPAQLEKAITPKTKLFILNSPSNPTGSVYSSEELKALAAVLLKHPHVLILSDDIYESIYWNIEPFTNIIMVCPELYERTIVVNGISKAYAATGWRLGYAAGSVTIINAMKKLQSQSTSNAASMVQAAAEAALNGSQQCVLDMCKVFKQRHDHVLVRLNQLPGFKCAPAEGAFYFFPYVKEAQDLLGLSDDLAFSEWLLTEASVAVVPGSAFGAPDYIRLSYATSLEKLDKAIDNIAKAMAEMKK